MAEAKSIEALSLSFTAGALMGSMVSGNISWAVSSAALAVAFLPVVLGKRLLSFPDPFSVGLVLVSFLMLGMFSEWVAVLPAPASAFPLEGVASEAADRLKGLIGRIPFPSEKTAPLLTALLTGDRSALAGETVTAFRESGASHILALSGLHMGIIYLLFDKVTGLAGRTPAARVIRLVSILLASGFFTLMTGASPSLMRAFLFITINEVLRFTGRPRKASRVLCLALLIQLVLTPDAIRSLGFQLSYLAMAGIFLLHPVLERWYPESVPWDPLRYIWKAASMSISCQVFTGPLAWLRFHTFPQYFLLTNLIALPLTTALMTSAVLTVILSGIGLCPAFLTITTDALCNWLQRALEIIASL